MSDEEFDLIDELYFVSSYQDLKSALAFSDDSLKFILVNLIQKGWVKIFKTVDEEGDLEDINRDNNFRKCFFLVSKKGLFEHNTQ